MATSADHRRLGRAACLPPICCGKRGLEVAVFERATGDLGDRGTGIGTRAELFAVMRRIGLAADASIGIGCAAGSGSTVTGGVMHELRCAP